MYFNKNYESELISILEKLISFKTVYEESDEFPFGIENKKCLDYVLELGKKYGFKTKNLDNYCGYLEIGEGVETIGIVTHLDVVPEGEGWDTNPYVLTKVENKLYGRGTNDDKGATAASIIALKIINDLGVKLNKKVRLILGCNEESGCECIKHYIKKEGNFDYGFTPDGDFPLIHGEKGMIHGTIKGETTKIIEISGGTVPNAVPNKCTSKVKSDDYDKDKLINFIKNNNLKIDIVTNNEVDIITVEGISAHASTPELGKNAISYLLVGLRESGLKDPFTEFYYNNVGLSFEGENCGLNLKDEYGNLTFNIGVISKEENEITATIDIRFPVTFLGKEVLEKLTIKEEDGCSINFEEPVEPLFYKMDTLLVQKLYEAYKEVSNDKISKPLVIGGGTYAKSMKNCIAFGPNFQDEDNHIHDVNEFVEIDKLYKQVDYYITAILKLLEI